MVTNEAEQKLHRSVDTVAAHIKTEIVVAGIVTVTSRIGLRVEFTGVVIILDEDARFALIDMIEFHNSLDTLVHRCVKEDAELVGMVFEDVKAATPDNDARLQLGYFPHGFGLGVEELPGSDVAGGRCVFVDAHEVLVELGEVFPPGRSFLLQCDGLFLCEIKFFGYCFQYLLIDEFDIETPGELGSNGMSASPKLTVDGDDVLIVEVHSVGF